MGRVQEVAHRDGDVRHLDQPDRKPLTGVLRLRTQRVGLEEPRELHRSCALLRRRRSAFLRRGRPKGEKDCYKDSDYSHYCPPLGADAVESSGFSGAVRHPLEAPGYTPALAEILPAHGVPLVSVGSSATAASNRLRNSSALVPLGSMGSPNSLTRSATAGRSTLCCIPPGVMITEPHSKPTSTAATARWELS